MRSRSRRSTQLRAPSTRYHQRGQCCIGCLILVQQIVTTVSSYKIKGEGGTTVTRSIIHLRSRSRRSTQSRTPSTDIHQKRKCCNGGLLSVQMIATKHLHSHTHNNSGLAYYYVIIISHEYEIAIASINAIANTFH